MVSLNPQNIYNMIFSDSNKRTQYNSAPWHTRYFRNSTFWWSIYGIYVILSTKILEIFFKGNLQLFSTRALFHHTYFDGPQDHCNCNPKSREIFFWSWQVNFDMIDIEPSLDRSWFSIVGESRGFAGIWSPVSGKKNWQTVVLKLDMPAVLDCWVDFSML